ncbi:MAG TPA: VOC family protein, partial [Woeseiaceae bacterium]
MPAMQKMAACLWFDTEAEAAAQFYTGIFENSKITEVSRYGKEGHEIHGREPGSVMTVSFELDGQSFTALNGGPIFRFNEAVSFQISCADQAEYDR